MYAAVVTEFGKPPTYQQFPEPQPRAGEVVVDMLAAGLHQRVRSGAAGTHYTSDGKLPLVPGFDGVGRTADGTRVFVADLPAPEGTMAQRVAAPADRLIPIPDGLPDPLVAAAMNPAMSAWVALTRRAVLRPGETVLVLGATGAAGRMAVQLARHLGAAHVIAAGRNTTALAELADLGADQLVTLTGEESAFAGLPEIDVVVDYLWGPVAETAMAAIAAHRADPARRLRWVHVGAMAGATITLPGAALRKTNLEISGSGQGSVSPPEIHAAHVDLLAAMPAANLRLDVITLPLADVERAWAHPVPTGTRLVLTP